MVFKIKLFIKKSKFLIVFFLIYDQGILKETKSTGDLACIKAEQKTSYILKQKFQVICNACFRGSQGKFIQTHTCSTQLQCCFGRRGSICYIHILNSSSQISIQPSQLLCLYFVLSDSIMNRDIANEPGKRGATMHEGEGER